MSPVHPSELRRDRGPKPVLLRDQACAGCGYNLKGLVSGSRCPECGQTIRAVDVRMGDTISEAPMGYLRSLGIGAVLLAVAYMPLVVLGVASLIIGASNAPRMGVVLTGLASAVAAGVWVAGVLIVARPRRSSLGYHEGERKLFRTGALASQSLWIVAALLAASGGLFPSATPLAIVWAVGIALLAAYFGLALVAIHLAGLCEWANDTALAGWFRTVAWIVFALGGFLLVGKGLSAVYAATSAAVLTPFMGFIAMGLAVSYLGVAIGLFMQGILHLNFCRMVRWSMRISHAQMDKNERTARRAERLARQGEEEREVNAPPPSRPGPIEIAPSGTPIDVPIRPQGKVIERPEGGAREYDLDR